MSDLSVFNSDHPVFHLVCQANGCAPGCGCEMDFFLFSWLRDDTVFGKKSTYLPALEHMLGIDRPDLERINDVLGRTYFTQPEAFKGWLALWRDMLAQGSLDALGKKHPTLLERLLACEKTLIALKMPKGERHTADDIKKHATAQGIDLKSAAKQMTKQATLAAVTEYEGARDTILRQLETCYHTYYKAVTL